MAEDMLMLNISSAPVKFDKKTNRRPLSSAEKWTQKKWESKRKAVFEPQESSASKQRKINQTGQQHTHKQKLQTHRSPSQRSNNRDTEENGDQREKSAAKSQSKVKTFPKKAPEEHGDHGRPFIKTSSLFRNNPEIPDVLSPAVNQVKEKVFTSNTFEELNLHPHLVATLHKVLNVNSMTSVQKKTIPVLMSGKDAVVRSQTGSGKTLAYGIPVVQFLQAMQPKVKRSDGPLAVVIVPTRELALQSFQMFQKLLKPFTWIVPGVLMGGEKRKAEKARLRKGINVLISTPGRLVDHIKNTLSIAFSAVCWLILDEADRTLDLGFEKDLTVILNALNATGLARQNVLLSATLTEGLSRLASISMKEPVSIHVSEGSEDTVEACPQAAPQALSDSYAVPERLQQHVVVVPSKLHLVSLAAFILAKCKFEQRQKIIVFISSCEAVEFLLALFTAVLCVKPSAASTKHTSTSLYFYRLHGNMRQEERTEAFQEFSQCKTGILLCTDVAARGLDLPQVTWIVQYNPPVSAAEYVHRVGRTARIGAQGSSLLFLTPSETAFVDVLANHNISLSEMKMEDILATLMKDERFKGRGKWDSKRSATAFEQEVRERATVLQTDFENYVHANNERLQTAKSALQSFLRAYTTYPSSLKHIFHIRSLHLGHAAKSFGLRDAPQGLGSSITTNPANSKDSKKGKDKAKRPPKKLTAKERVSNLMRSEYLSGIDGESKSKKKRKKNKGQVEEEQSTGEGRTS
ncbi:probable ATP-dependent RNA helicase DDX31 [Carassius carassius]|uniref:probable ATP-dependent RNA helicase DDX31 n=1 Tax=Carassius carassius TaxID=217509 RepID=UPI002868C812|nr:probable ATP-dependent RNA helicase DDX31 [Carassius carassius]XP_059404255.1 probable ATP-dependent RNA helicase DDX31 [Carassius carassius]